MPYRTSVNSDLADLRKRDGQQHVNVGQADDFAFVAGFCVIGLLLCFSAIAGAPDVGLTIAKAFAAFCGVSPAG